MLLSTLKNEVVEIKAAVEEEFGGFSYDQLTWKPDADTWSIGQNLEHLIIFNEHYLENLGKVADGSHSPNIWSRIPFISAVVGSQLKKAVAPANKKKVATFSVFKPTASETVEAILEDFQTNQDRLFELIDSLNTADLEKVIVTPVSNMVTISVGDALQVLVSHERRHFEQATGIAGMDGFPK